MMMRTMTLTAALLAATAEPIGADVDLTKYAITQGGLLAVVFVLLFFYRRDFMRKQQRDEDQIAILTSLVEKNTTALVATGSAITANEKATHRLSRAIESTGRV